MRRGSAPFSAVASPWFVSSDDSELSPGAKVGNYVITEPIDSGGCGAVYAAKSASDGHSAAIKVLHRALSSSDSMMRRFEREAQVLKQLQHPAIVEVYEVGELESGRPFIAMELLSATSLRSIIEERGRLSPAEALEYLRPVCQALELAHGLGIVHRDLKASNIAATRKDGRIEVKLLDFGVAKLIHPEPGEQGLTTAGQRLGSPLAMAPEQIRGGDVDLRADIYALGILLFHMCAGQYPFIAFDPLGLERLHLEAPPPRLSQLAPVPPALDQVVARCLEKDPERRFPSAAAFLDALTRAVEGPRESASRSSTAERAVGIYVEAAIGTEDLDDETVMSLSTFLDGSREALVAGGLGVELETGNALLGVKVLSKAPASELEERRSALEVARTIADLGADRQIRVAVRVHVDTIDLHQGVAGPEISGGAILDIDLWVLDEETTAGVDQASGTVDFRASRPAVKGIEQ